MANPTRKKCKLIIITCNDHYYQEWDNYCFTNKIKNRSKLLRHLIEEQMKKNINTKDTTC